MARTTSGSTPPLSPHGWAGAFLRVRGAIGACQGRTHCPRGHELTEGNTYVNLLKSGAVSRQCKTCVKHRAKHGHYPEPVEAMATSMAHLPVDTSQPQESNQSLTTSNTGAPSRARSGTHGLKEQG